MSSSDAKPVSSRTRGSVKRKMVPQLLPAINKVQRRIESVQANFEQVPPRLTAVKVEKRWTDLQIEIHRQTLNDLEERIQQMRQQLERIRNEYNVEG